MSLPNNLKSFMEQNVKQGVLPCNLHRELYERRKHHTESIIVIDANLLHKAYFESGMDPYDACLTKFYESLRLSGATLVFFASTNFINQSEMDALKKWELTFQNIRYNEEIAKNCEFYKTNQTTDNMYRLFANYGRSYIFSDDQYHLHMAKYATEMNALAIIGDNLNFLIYEGDWKYITFNEMIEYQEYDRIALRNALGLTQHQMALFGAMISNYDVDDSIGLAADADDDYVYYYVDIDFGDDYVDADYEENINDNGESFRDIGKYIRENFRNLSSGAANLTEDNLKQISCKLFENTRPQKKQQQTIDILKAKLKSFDTCNGVSVDQHFITKTAFDQAGYNIILSYHYLCIKMLNAVAVNNKICRVIHNQQTFLPLKSILLPIMRRMIGALLKNKNDYVATVDVDRINKDPIEPDCPIMNVPEPGNLSNPSASDFTTFDVRNRFKLLSWIITGEGETELIELIKKYEYDEKDLVIRFTLHVMLKFMQIKNSEANGIFQMINAIRSGQLTALDGNKNKITINVDPVHQRSIGIIAMYEKIYELICLCFNLVGLKNYVKKIETNANYYQIIMKECADRQRHHDNKTRLSEIK